MQTYKITVRATQHSAVVEFAEYDTVAGAARFGYNAEARASSSWGATQDLVEFSASQGSIGSQSPEDSVIRAKLYLAAATVAALLSQMPAGSVLDVGYSALRLLGLDGQEHEDAEGNVVGLSAETLVRTLPSA